MGQTVLPKPKPTGSNVNIITTKPKVPVVTAVKVDLPESIKGKSGFLKNTWWKKHVGLNQNTKVGYISANTGEAEELLIEQAPVAFPGKYTIKNVMKNEYYSSAPGEKKPVTSKPTIGLTETYEYIHNPVRDIYCFRTSHGTYLSGRNDDSLQSISFCQDWEAFSFIPKLETVAPTIVSPDSLNTIVYLQN